MRTAAARTLGVFLAVFAAGVLIHELREIVKRDDVDAYAVFGITASLLMSVVLGWLASIALRNAALLSSAVVVLVAVLAAATAAYEPGLFAPERSFTLTPRQAGALRYLMHAGALEWPFVGIGGSDSDGYRAMRELSRSLNADGAFKELVLRGSPAGQLYGLIGVRRTDPLFYERNAWRCRTRRAFIGVSSGCSTSGERIANIVSARDAVRLPNGMTLNQWFRSGRNLAQPVVFDIDGGAYSSLYFDPLR